MSVRFATLYGCGSWHPETVAAIASEIVVTKTEVVTELGTSREAPKGDTGTRSEQVLLHCPRLSGTTSELRSGSGGSVRIPVRASGEHSEEGPPAPPSGPLGGTRHLLHARTCTRLNAFFGVACSLCLGVLFLVPAPSAARGSTRSPKLSSDPLWLRGHPCCPHSPREAAQQRGSRRGPRGHA